MSTLPEKCFIYKVTMDNWETNFEVGAVALDSGSAEHYIKSHFTTATIKPVGDCVLVAPPYEPPTITEGID